MDDDVNIMENLIKAVKYNKMFWTFIYSNQQCSKLNRSAVYVKKNLHTIKM